MTSEHDRLIVVTDILLGAAFADSYFAGAERDKIKELLTELIGGDALPAGVLTRIDDFDPDHFDLAATAQAFVDDPLINKHNLLELVAAVHDADEEIDLAEDSYIHDLADAIGVAADEYADLVLDYEVEELQENLTGLRQPPPIPGTTTEDDDDLDIDVE
jgi:uncharacterized tellurite resistance protein B-like protein